MFDDLGNRENHGSGIAILHPLPVHVQSHVQILWIGNFIPGDQPRPCRAKSVTRFSFGPLTGQVGLKMALRHIVDNAIARHMIERFGLIDIFCSFANHYAQFDFPVGFDGSTRHRYIIIGADNGRIGFKEQNWMLWNGRASFGGVI